MAQTHSSLPVEEPSEPAGPPALRELSDAGALSRPLCVDLDGTLVSSDTLWESLLVLLRRRPWLALLVPLWLVGGRARFKRRISERVLLDAATLPYRADLVEALRGAAAAGRQVVLSTAADIRIARAVADHVGVFSDVMASDGLRNLKAVHKRDALVQRYGAAGFDYVGDSAADLPILEAASRGYVLGASGAVAARALSLGANVRVISGRRSRLRAAVKVLRPHQWSKNALVVVPALLAPHGFALATMLKAGLAAFCLSLCASAGYVINDVIDVAADRVHPTKRRRPFASGDLPLHYGPPLMILLLAVSFGLALRTLPLEFTGLLALYFALTLSYSFYFKSKLLADVLLLAWLYTHRVVAGGAATGVPISSWLLAFSMFLFLSLAFAKRYVELRYAASKQDRMNDKLHSRGYYPTDLEMIASMGPTAGFMAVLVFCLYIESNAGSMIFARPRVLWMAAPVLAYWITRVWFLSHRGQMNDDPVKFAITDRRSWGCAFAIAAVAAVARFWR